MINLDNHVVSLSCPKCKSKNRVTLRQIKNEESIQCVGCGVTINLKDKDGSVKKGTKKVQDSLDELHRTLRELGK